MKQDQSKTETLAAVRSSDGLAGVKYPAPYIVHTPQGPIAACFEHATKMRQILEFLGGHIAVTDAPKNAECINCVNEAKAKPANDKLRHGGETTQ